MRSGIDLLLKVLMVLLAAAIVFALFGTLWVLLGLPMLGFVEAAYRIPQNGLLAAFLGVWGIWVCIDEAAPWRRNLMLALIAAAVVDCGLRIVSWADGALSISLASPLIALNWVVGVALALTVAAIVVASRMKSARARE